MLRERQDHPAFSSVEVGILEDFRQPLYHALWDLPSYADYDFVEDDVREEADVRGGIGDAYAGAEAL